MSIDEFESMLGLSCTFKSELSNSSLSYNSLYVQNGYNLTPAKWRMRLCNLINNLLENKLVTIEYLMEKLQDELNSERYGFNGDMVLLLAKYNANMNSFITFRGMHCTLLHAFIHVFIGFNASNNQIFHNYLVNSKPIIDIKDEYGRTALTIAVWKLSKPIPNINEVQVVRALIKYGFNPFIKYRGITIMDKLSKICNMVRSQQTNQKKNNHTDQSNENVEQVQKVASAVQMLLDTYNKIKYFRSRVEAIQSSLKKLVDKNIIVDDIANVIEDCMGISHYSKRTLQKRNKYKPSLRQRIELLRRN